MTNFFDEVLNAVWTVTSASKELSQQGVDRTTLRIHKAVSKVVATVWFFFSFRRGIRPSAVAPGKRHSKISMGGHLRIGRDQYPNDREFRSCKRQQRLLGRQQTREECRGRCSRLRFAICCQSVGPEQEDDTDGTCVIALELCTVLLIFRSRFISFYQLVC